ncbi:hypothetical protein C8J56DRAFT_912005 [Mycena floridula]|nr:hypothetical protein C8J56DRAFT_912005 [Mycena floridula]
MLSRLPLPSILFASLCFVPLQCLSLSLHLLVGQIPTSTIYKSERANVTWDATEDAEPLPEYLSLWMRSIDYPTNEAILLTGRIESTEKHFIANISSAHPGFYYYLQASSASPPSIGSILANSASFLVLKPLSSISSSTISSTQSASSLQEPTAVSAVVSPSSSTNVLSSKSSTHFHAGPIVIAVVVLLLLGVIAAALLVHRHRRRSERRHCRLSEDSFPGASQYHYSPSTSATRTSLAVSSIRESESKVPLSNPFEPSEVSHRLQMPEDAFGQRSASWIGSSSPPLDPDVQRQLDQMAARIRQLEAERDNALSAVSPPDYVSLSGHSDRTSSKYG